MASEEGWERIDAWLAGLFAPADPALEAAARASREAGLPSIEVSPVQGKLLLLLARLQGARRILEIGTLGGVSTLWLARALPEDGRLVSLEIEPRHAEVARHNLARAGLSDRVEVRLGPALELLPELAGAGAAPFDLVFLDADKAAYPDYLAWSLALTRPGSLIVADNVVRRGAVVDPESREAAARGVRRFLELLAADERVCATALQTVGAKGHDGFALALVTGGV